MKSLTNCIGSSQSGTCADNRKLITYSLFGTDPFYIDGAISCAESVKEFYPDWTARFYVSTSVKDSVRELLSKTGSEVVIKDKSEEGSLGLFWRFYPISDPAYEYVIIRDTDSRFTNREVVAVNDWIDSNRTMHVIRDHPNHQSVVMGGLWGIKGGHFLNMEERVNKWRRNCAWTLDKSYNQYGGDQTFLSEVVYPEFKDDVLIHSEHVSYPDEYPVTIPHQRQNHEFLGQRCPEDRDVLKMQKNLLDQHNGRIKTYPFQVRDGLLTNLKNKIK